MQERLYWAQIGDTLAHQVWNEYGQDIEAIAGAREAVIVNRHQDQRVKNIEFRDGSKIFQSKEGTKIALRGMSEKEVGVFQEMRKGRYQSPAHRRESRNRSKT